MRVLHLALEDHRRTGSGGGSLRNHQINSRLAAAGHSIEVVTAAFKGSQERVEDGVHYRHVGLPLGYAPSLLSYQARLHGVVRAAERHNPPDLIIEEFAPLTSSLGVGHWTNLPTIGLVQGFFAREKARQYHLPVRVMTAVERWGTRSHRELVAVSAALRRQLLAVAPATAVTVVPNGVDLAAAAIARDSVKRRGNGAGPTSLLYLGRLETHQKGLDFLIEALAKVSSPVSMQIAGAGKDLRKLRQMVDRAGLSPKVSFIGAVSGSRKWQLLARADAVVLPSRYETFGITALEAMACGTPVIASDLACLRELVAPDAGILVRSGDTAALSEAIARIAADSALRDHLGRAGVAVAERYGWDERAAEQGAVYARAAERETT